jgi:putative membrane protein
MIRRRKGEREMKQVANLGLAVLASLMLSSGLAWAQDDATVPEPSGTDAAVEVKATSYVEQTAMGDMFAAKSSELALSKSGNPQVRAFAQHMITDQATSSRELKQALGAAKIDAPLPTTLDGEHQQLLDTLQASTGADFDRNYLKMQMDGHQKALQTQVDYRLHGGNKELQDFATKATTMVQTHLSELGKITQGALLSPQ